MSKKRINWGIIAPGHIAEKFAKDIPLADDSVLYAVASRNKNKAERFAEKHNAVKSFGSYAELAEDPNVDVVYIASPHVFHYEHTKMCLNAGKHVLCEKPLAMNYRQAKEMIDLARKKSLFLSEGLWTRYIPATEKVLSLLESGILGEIQLVKADFGFKAEFLPEGRLFNKDLGGGSLLDIGIYPVYLSLLLLGRPDAVKAFARFSETGVDSAVNILFAYNNHANAILDANLDTNTATEAWIYGDKAAIKMHGRFHHAQKLSLYKNHKVIDTFEIKYTGNGYVHEIEATGQCLLRGQTENPKLSLNFSLDLMHTLDQIREIIGLSYAADKH